MKKIKFLTNSILIVAAALLLGSSSIVAQSPEWLPVRTAQQMKEPSSGVPSSATWIGTGYVNQGVDNMGNTTTLRVPVVAGTEYMYFNSGYRMLYTISGNGYQTQALSSVQNSPSGGQFFDAFVVGNNVSRMIESDGCVQVTYRYFGSTYPGQFIMATASYSMFK